MPQRLTITLVGPRSAGKSTLIAALPDCFAQGAHGYPSALRLTLQPIGRGEFEGGYPAASKYELLESFVSPYERLRETVESGGEPTPPETLQEYFFRLNAEASQDLSDATRLLEIVDVGGGLAAPEEGQPQSASVASRVQFATKLLASDAIVFVLPLVRLEECRWVGSMSRLIERLALAPDRKAKRFVVAWSFYERLFVNLGPAAFTYACDPLVAAHVLRRALAQAPWLDALRELEREGASLRFCVFSSYGFVKTFQNPNLDPLQSGERRFSRVNGPGRPSLTEFWRPFLAADPIVNAALGLDSAFCFSYERLAAPQGLVAE
ncbi:hypothetical protein B1812_20335 [Methylocystis bryophila]|uniref:Uncharacterized protein n=1 Tax=Methylocystis bryophila TaxID=655015 RepID=A0A1W6N1W5_9HYPH|nr:hypothetical protein B1812_20335 [Methylocystis bryophila]